MNSTFKVVFNKARGALMVVNEVTSSVQAKGTKTVVATAVAAMIAGVAGTAVAADYAPKNFTPADKATIAGSVVVTGDKTAWEGDVWAIKSDVESGASTKLQTGVSGTTTVADTISFNENSAVTLKGGELTVKAQVAVPSGAGTAAISAAAGVATIKSVSGVGTLNIIADAGKADAAAINGATLNYQSTSIGGADDEAITINFGKLEGAKAGTATLNASAALTLGADTVSGDDRFHEAGAVALNVAEGADAAIKAAGAIVFKNVQFQNKGTLTVASTSGGTSFYSDYDGTSEANSGKLIVEKSGNNGTHIRADFSDEVIYIGEGTAEAVKKAGADTHFKDYVWVSSANAQLAKDPEFTPSLTATEALYVDGTQLKIFKNGAVTTATANVLNAGYIDVGSTSTKGTFAAETLNLKNGALNVAGSGVAEVGTINTNGGTITVRTETVDTNGVLKTYKGKLEVEGAINVIDGTNTIDNTSKLTADSIDLKAAVIVEGTSTTKTQPVLNIQGANGQTVIAGGINVQGTAVAGSTETLNATLNVNASAVGLNAKKGEYNLKAESLTVGDHGVVTLASGSSTKVGSVAIAEKATFTGSEGSTFVADSLELAKKATATFGALTVTDGTNDGTLTAQTAKVKGDFTNNAVVSTETATSGNITNYFEATNLTVDGGNFVNEGKVNVTNLTVTNGGVYQSEFLLTNDAKKTNTNLADGATISVLDGATLAVVDFNSHVAANPASGAAFDMLTLGRDLMIDGGYVTVKGEKLAGKTVTVAADVTVENRDDLAVGTVIVNEGSMTIDEDADATIGTLNVASGSVTVGGWGSLTVTDKLVNSVSGTIEVETLGELNLTAGVIGMTVAQNGTVTFASDANSLSFNDIKTTNGEVTVDGISGKVNFTQATALKNKFGLESGSGIVYLNGLTVDLVQDRAASEGVAAITNGQLNADGTIKIEAANDLGGLVVEATKNLTVKGVTAAGLRGEFGKVIMDGLDESAVKDLVATNTLVLNGSGDLVTYKTTASGSTAANPLYDDNLGNLVIGTASAPATFVYDGETNEANIGTVTGASGGANFFVSSGTLNAKSVKVDSAAGALVAIGEAGTLNVAEKVEANVLLVEGALSAGKGLTVAKFFDAEGATTTVTTGDMNITSYAESETVNGTTTYWTDINGAVDVQNGNLTVANEIHVGETGSLKVKGDVTGNKFIVAGTMTVDPIKVENDVEGISRLNANRIEVNDGTLTALGEVNVQRILVREGTVALGTYNARVATDGDIAWQRNGNITVGNATKGGVLSVNKLESGYVFADPDFDENGVISIENASKVFVAEIGEDAAVQAGRGSLAVIGQALSDESVAAAKAAFAAAGLTQLEKDKVESALYIDASNTIEGAVLANGAYRQVIDEAGNVRIEGERIEAVIGSAGFEGLETYGLFADEDTLVVLDAKTFGDKQLVADGSDVELLGDTYIANASAHQTLKLTGDLVEDGEVVEEGYVDIHNLRVDASRILAAKVADQTLTVDVKTEEELANISGLKTLGTIVSHYDQNQEGGASKSAKFNEWLMQDKSINGLKDAEVVQAGNDVAGIGASAGMVSVTMDALSAFNDTVAQRTSILAPNAEGTTVWADVNGGKYEAKKLFNGAGYSSDIYAGVLGVDTVVACGAKIGAALTVGTGDTDSKNTTAETSMDSDFFGISVYTAKQFGVANVAVDLGYMQGSNDVSVKAYDLGKFSADTDAFTLGIRGELLTKAGDFNIVPHAGLRWTRVSVDSFEAGYTTDIDDMNVFQLPVGVTVSGEFEGAGFTWAPAFDLSFVPAFGDKDADMTLGIAGSKAASTAYGIQVIDSNPVQATIGIDATNGAWSFGLNYKLGVGTDSRLNNALNANVRYTF